MSQPHLKDGTRNMNGICPVHDSNAHFGFK